MSSARASGSPVGYLLLPNKSSVPRIVDDESLAAEGVLKELPLLGANPADAHPLPQHQTFGDNQLLFINGLTRTPPGSSHGFYS
jgi:hypothetical protein